MRAMQSRLTYVVLVVITGLLCLGTGPALGQTTASPQTEAMDPTPSVEGNGEGAEAPNAANPPAYIVDLVKRVELPEGQLGALRAEGMGWGEIRIAIRLAEQMAANPDDTLDFEGALTQVLAARAEGKGFGEIAAENGLKIGDLVSNEAAQARKQGSAAQQHAGNRVQTATAEQKKPGFLARLGRVFGWGRSGDRPATPEGGEPVRQSAKALKDDTPGKPAGVGELQASAKALRGEKPERPFRPERAGRPERLETVEKPAKPERPERGPQR